MFIIFTTQLSLINFEIDNCMPKRCRALWLTAGALALAKAEPSWSELSWAELSKSCVQCFMQMQLKFQQCKHLLPLPQMSTRCASIFMEPSPPAISCSTCSPSAHLAVHMPHLPGHRSATIWRFALACVCLAIIVWLCNCICTPPAHCGRDIWNGNALVSFQLMRPSLRGCT